MSELVNQKISLENTKRSFSNFSEKLRNGHLRVNVRYETYRSSDLKAECIQLEKYGFFPATLKPFLR